MLRKLHHIPLSELTVSKLNVRRHGAKEIDSLAASIAALGIIQPLLVRRDGDGYEIVAGRRRYLAAKKLDARRRTGCRQAAVRAAGGRRRCHGHRGIAGRERRAPADGRPGAVRGVRGAAQEGPARGRHRRALRHFRADRQTAAGHRQPAPRHPPPLPGRRDRDADLAAADAGHQGAAEGMAGAAQRSASRSRRHPGSSRRGCWAAPRSRPRQRCSTRRRTRAASPPTCSASSGISPTGKSSGACRTPPSPSAASSCSSPAGARCTSSSPTGASSRGTTRRWPRLTAARSTSWWSRTAMSPCTRDSSRAASATGEAADRRGRQQRERRRVERPEMSAPLASYVDLVRHSAVRLAVADAPDIALRLMLAHAIGGGRWWKVEAEPQRPATPAIGEAVAALASEGAFAKRRAKAAKLSAHRSGRRTDRCPRRQRQPHGRGLRAAARDDRRRR